MRADFCFELVILKKIANFCTSWRASFQELSHPGGWMDSAESLGTTLLTGGLSTDTSFGTIHLAGHHL